MPPAEAAGEPDALRPTLSRSGDVVEAADRLARGREAYVGRRWRDAYESLSHADQAAPLGAEELELLATSAYMLGRDEEYLERPRACSSRATSTPASPAAVRCAFWMGMHLALRGEMGRATGWLGRAQRLLEREERDCVERGLPAAAADVRSTRRPATTRPRIATAAEAAEIGERFGDADLFALALHEQGHVLVKQGRVAEGLALLDEAMVAVTAGELSPIVTGMVYCSVIVGCQQAYELRRAQRVDGGADALVRAATRHGRLHGHVPGAPRRDHAAARRLAATRCEEARRAGERCAQAVNRVAARGLLPAGRDPSAAGRASTRPRRPTGRRAGAGASRSRAWRCCGWPRATSDAAAAAIRRVGGRDHRAVDAGRAAAGLRRDHARRRRARGGARRLRASWRGSPSGYGSDMLGAMVAQARGAVDWPRRRPGCPGRAAPRVRRCGRSSRRRTRRARARAGRAARAAPWATTTPPRWSWRRPAASSRELGAAPDLARRRGARSRAAPRDAHGLTARELQVLRLVAAGKTNKAIAAELVLSERTVDRHVSNIFAKLRRVVARRGHGLRVRAPAHLSGAIVGENTHAAAAAEVGCFRRCAAS